MQVTPQLMDATREPSVHFSVAKSTRPFDSRVRWARPGQGGEVSRGGLLIGMELARARADGGTGEAEAALARAGDAYERARQRTRRAGGEAAQPGQTEAAWRGLGRILAALLAIVPGWRRGLEDRLLGSLHAGPSGPDANGPER